ncbi:hypothetical protein TW85_16040 [Marinomonas sp. S3726]|nr:hypothetical protein TW85_16040 [Marinomonas sp. S3726]
MQAWQILVGAAMNRQTLTYKLLSIKMFQKEASGVLDKTLGHIAFYCDDYNLPALTSIVVGKKRGTPGHDIPLNSERFDQAREEVYDFDWYDIYPPSAKELLQSFKSNV